MARSSLPVSQALDILLRASTAELSVHRTGRRVEWGLTLQGGSYPPRAIALRCVHRNVSFAVAVLEAIVSATLAGRHTTITLAKLEPRHPLAGGIPPATNPPTLWVFERGLRPRRPPLLLNMSIYGCRYPSQEVRVRVVRRFGPSYVLLGRSHSFSSAEAIPVFSAEAFPVGSETRFERSRV